jgi:MFS family permease
VLFVLALLAFFAIALPDAMLGVVWPAMRISFDQPLAAMTLVLPFGVAATVVSTSCWTWAAAGLGLGRLLAASVALSAVALAICAVAPAYWVIVGCAVLFGLSSGAIDAALNAYAARHFGPRRINLMHAAFGVGAATSPLIVTSVAGWRSAYVIVMVIQSAAAVLFAASARRWSETPTGARRPGPETPAGTRSESPAGTRSESRPGTRAETAVGVRRARAERRPSVRAVAGLLLVAVDSGLESVVGLWAFVFLIDAVGLPRATAGLVVSGYWAALVVGRVVLGSVAERAGTWPVLACATVAAIGAAASIASLRPAAAAAGIVLLGLAVAPIYPLLVLTTAERTSAGFVDRLVGFQAAASTIGSVSFAGAAGLVVGADVSGFAGCVLALAVLTGGGVWALRPGRRG